MPRRHALAALACTLLLPACHQTEPRAPAPLQSVTATRLTTHVIQGGLTASGRLVSREEVGVTADLNGYRVAKVLVEEGARVRQGQVLAVLDDSLLTSQIDQLRASLAQQEIAARQARDQADRVSGLDGKGVLSDEAIANRRIAARSGDASAAATRAQLRDLLVRKDHLIIHAPCDGLVLERTVRPGDPSSTGTTMFRIARDSLIELYAEVPEADVGGIHPGDPAAVMLASGHALTGQVRLIGKRVDAQTGLVIARIALPPDPELRDGGYAQARFDRTVSVLAVPEAAVHFDADGASLRLLDDQQRVHTAHVRTSRRAGGLVEIVSGAPAGSLVAVKGSAFVLNGDKVRVIGGEPR
jgi:HlyD family secretion protein